MKNSSLRELIRLEVRKLTELIRSSLDSGDPKTSRAWQRLRAVAIDHLRQLDDDEQDAGSRHPPGTHPAPTGQAEEKVLNEVLDSKNASSASSTKRASSKKIPSGSSGSRGRQPLEYHLDNRFNLMLKAFPMERTGPPARAFALWKTLDTDRKAQLEVAIYDYLQKTKPEFYTQFVSLVESWVAQHPPVERSQA